MNRKLFSTLLTLAFASSLAFGPPASAKSKKPSLGVRVSPRMAFSPVGVIATAELKGGEDSEEFYCLAIEWDWDDGSKSLQDSDCDPYQPGTKIDRRFSSEHYYSRAGNYNIRAALKASEKIVAANSFRLTVRQGLPQGPGDPRDPGVQ
ncbi:MAG: hypothetical protein JJE39_16305 [Vicinamibacteria bacterium]|nr:hypothetical protein [Vicinamibacteria bacterium]